MRIPVRQLPVLAYLSLVLPGCGSGFQVKEPPLDQIMTIRNESVISSQTTPETHLPFPLPILPSTSRDGMTSRPFILIPRGIPPRTTVPSIPGRALGEVTLADVTQVPFSSYGSLTFFQGTAPYRCTAEFVGPAGDIILTAAHCVFSNDSQTWNSGFTLYAQYDSGSYTQALNWECAAIFSGWAYDQYAFDYAFIKLRGVSANTLGLRGQTLPAAWKSAGYPVNYYSGARLVQVDGNNGGGGGGVVRMAGNPFKNGSSGGAWLEGASAIGLNSFGYDDDPSSMWGPQFDGNTIRLFEFVNNNCAVPSLQSNIAQRISQYPRNEVVIEIDRASRPLAPVLSYETHRDCACAGARRVRVDNLGSDAFVADIRTINYADTREDERATVDSAHLPAKSSRILGCTAGNVTTKTACSQKHTYSIQAARRVRSAVDVTGLRALNTVSPEFCSQKCSDPNSVGYCLRLGAGAEPVLTPLASFVSDTLNATPNNGVVATVSDMVKTFNGDPDKIGNPCGRSSFYRAGDEITNDGVDCRVTTAALEEGTQALRLSMVNPTQAQASRVGARADSAQLAIFRSRAKAPSLEFFGPANVDELNAEFGGIVVAVERTDKLIIVTTENGCLSGARQ